MDDGNIITTAEANGLIEVVQTDGLTLPTDLGPDTALLTDGTLNGQQVIILTSEDGKITGIQALPELVQGTESDSLESPAKKFRLEQEDGQTYVLALAGSETDFGQASLVGEEDTIIHQEGVHDLTVGDLPGVEGGAEVEGAKGSVVSQEWFTTKDDKTALQSQGLSWKQGQWGKDEVELLKNNIMIYCKERNIGDPTEIIFEMSKDERKDFYRTIARGLQRPLFSVYRRVIRMYDHCNHIGKYTPDELARLSELRLKHGPDWATIGAALGRSASSVKDRCRLMKDTCNTGKWLTEEECRLASAVYDLAGCKPGDSVTSGLSWSMVAERVGTRSEKQCRTKWLNYLNWKLQKGGTEWTREDDITLVLKIANSGAADETGIDWQELAQRWPSVRSPQWLRGKWWSMKRHVPDYQNLSFTEIVEYLRTMHSQNYRVKPPVTSNLRVRPGDLQRVGVVPNMTVSVPVSMADATGDVQSVTVGSEDSDGGGTTYQAYEILQSLGGTAGAHQGAFLITQPQNNPAISFAASNLSTDHIIVHTLPMAQGNDNVAVQMNPDSPVIITPAGEDGVAALQGATLQLTDGDQALQLTESGQIEGTEITSVELAGDDIATQAEIITTDDHTFEAQTITAEDIGEGVSRSGLDVPEVVTSDLVLVPASAASPQFVQAGSSETDLIHMSSLSDPMLTSESADLIGCPSDCEGEKSQSNDADTALQES